MEQHGLCRWRVAPSRPGLHHRHGPRYRSRYERKTRVGSIDVSDTETADEAAVTGADVHLTAGEIERFFAEGYLWIPAFTTQSDVAEPREVGPAVLCSPGTGPVAA